MNKQQLVESSSPPKFAGLPAGATQVGGTTLSLQPRQRNRPAPLSEVNYHYHVINKWIWVYPYFLDLIRFSNKTNFIDIAIWNFFDTFALLCQFWEFFTYSHVCRQVFKQIYLYCIMRLTSIQTNNKYKKIPDLNISGPSSYFPFPNFP